MGLLQVVKKGVVQGNTLNKIYDYSKKNNFAILSSTAINTEIINTVLKSASNLNTAVAIQVSYNNAKTFAGKVIQGDAAFLGALIVANHVHTVADKYKTPVILSTDYVDSENLYWIDDLIDKGSQYYSEHSKALFSSYSLDISNMDTKDGIKLAKKYLKKISKIGSGLDLKIGKKYSKVENMFTLYYELSSISKHFTISLPLLEENNTNTITEIKTLQKKIEKEFNTKSKPISLVFNGDYSNKGEILKLIDVGVVKIDLNVEIINTYTEGMFKYFESNKNEKHLELKKCSHEGKKQVAKMLNNYIKYFNAKNSL